jgi:hypothetical protein
MAPLRNVKHEAFCRELLKAAKNGRGQGEAYLAAGYKADGHGADVCASRLLKNVHIRARVAELSEPAAKKTKISVESLLAQLEATVAGATEAKQFGAVNGSLALIGKLTGLLRDQIEIGAVGSFGECTTIPQLVEALLADQSAPEALQTLEELRQAIELHALTRAAVVVAEPDRYRINESALSLAALRPQRKNGRGR